MIHSFTITLTGDNNTTINMTGGTWISIDMQKFSVNITYTRY